jgi:hypothetical protein
VAPSFDLTSDPSFLLTLLEIGDTVPEEFFEATQAISQALDWNAFCRLHSWARHDVPSMDTYPGTPEYYTFTVKLMACRLKVYCFLHSETGVVCAVGCRLA